MADHRRMSTGQLVAALLHGDDPDAAADELIRRRDMRVVPHLAEEIRAAARRRGRFFNVRRAPYAGRVLGGLRAHSLLLTLLTEKHNLPVVDFLAPGMHDAPPHIYEQLVTWLDIGDTESIRTINLARYAAQILGHVGYRPAVTPLIALLRHEHPGPRGSAADALGKIGDVRAVEPLIFLLDDPDKVVPQFAIAALGELGDARAIEPLAALLQRRPWSKRFVESTVPALARIGGPVAQQAILDVLPDVPGGWPTESLARTLRKIDTPTARYVLAYWEMPDPLEAEFDDLA